MIKVLHKALNVLEFISRYPEGQPLSAIAAAIGEKATTTSNIVQVLAQRNYLERKDGKWLYCPYCGSKNQDGGQEA